MATAARDLRHAVVDATCNEHRACGHVIAVGERYLEAIGDRGYVNHLG
jgi:hypothetical protein